ncbi:MAG: ATP-binding protein [Deltaproteobacteria bacterium]|nr:ATP-binding protein [Deltaproteobacteria bacterium]
MRYIPRHAARALAGLLRNFPAVLVYGPRQCGKSTLVRAQYPAWVHLDLERPVDYSLLQADLEGFFDANPRRVVIDEAQRLPELFPALRHVIDRAPGRGRFLLLGSAHPAFLRTASETLAGRLGLLELTPFTVRELAAVGRRRERWFWGGFPPVHARRNAVARAAWLDSYVSAFLERDLPSLGPRLPAPRLRALWTMLTHVHGSLLNVSDLARSLTVSSHTVADHLDVLEAAQMVRRLAPHHANVQKRLTKSPKVYVRDTGLLHFLAGLRRPGELLTWPRRGHSFEGLVVEELCTLAVASLVRPELSFWRTQAGAEVDLLIGDGRRLLPVEIKLGASVDRHGLAGLRQCMADLGLRRGLVVYTGTERRALGRGIELVPWSEIAAGRETLGLGAR